MSPPARNHDELIAAARRVLDTLTDWPRHTAPIVVDQVCARTGAEPTEALHDEAQRRLAAGMLDHTSGLASDIDALLLLRGGGNDV